MFCTSPVFLSSWALAVCSHSVVVGFAITWWSRVINPCSLMIQLCVGTRMRCWQIASALKLLSQASTFWFLAVEPRTALSKSSHCKWNSSQISSILLWTDGKGRHGWWGYQPKVPQEAEAGKNCGVQLLVFLLRESEEIQQVAIFRFTSLWLFLKAAEAVASFSQAGGFPAQHFCLDVVFRNAGSHSELSTSKFYQA